jgi:hypothetical protein
MPALRGYNVSSRSENEIGKHHYLIVPQDEEINVATNFSRFLRAGNTPNNKHSYFGLSRIASTINSQNLQKHFPKLIETSFLISYYLRTKRLYKNWLFLCQKKNYRKKTQVLESRDFSKC